MRLREVVHCRRWRPGPGSVTPHLRPSRKGRAWPGRGQGANVRRGRAHRIQPPASVSHQPHALDVSRFRDQEERTRQTWKTQVRVPRLVQSLTGSKNHDSVFHYENKALKMEETWRLEKGALCCGLAVPAPPMGRRHVCERASVWGPWRTYRLPRPPRPGLRREPPSRSVHGRHLSDGRCSVPPVAPTSPSPCCLSPRRHLITHAVPTSHIYQNSRSFL